MAFTQITPEKARELRAACEIVHTILEHFHILEEKQDGWDELAYQAGKLHTELKNDGY